MPNSDVTSDRFTNRTSQPFRPLDPRAGGNLEMNTSLRTAHALEYIAVQMGEINAKLTVIVSKLEEQKTATATSQVIGGGKP